MPIRLPATSGLVALIETDGDGLYWSLWSSACCLVGERAESEAEARECIQEWMDYLGVEEATQ